MLANATKPTKITFHPEKRGLHTTHPHLQLWNSPGSMARSEGDWFQGHANVHAELIGEELHLNGEIETENGICAHTRKG